MNKKIIVISTAGLLLVALIVGFAFMIATDDTIAVVDGQKISKGELDELLIAQYGQQTLDLLITEKIIELESKKNNIVITETEIQENIEELQEQYGGEESLTAALEYSGMTRDDLEKNVELSVKIEKLVGPTISITQEEIGEYFELNKDSFTTDEEGQEVKLEDNEEEIRQILKDQKIQGEFDYWVMEKYDEYNIESFL